MHRSRRPVLDFWETVLDRVQIREKAEQRSRWRSFYDELVAVAPSTGRDRVGRCKAGLPVFERATPLPEDMTTGRSDAAKASHKVG